MRYPDFPPHPRLRQDGEGVVPAAVRRELPPEAAEDLRAIEILDYWRVIVERKRLILAFGLVGAVLGFLALIPQPFRFKSRTRIELHPATMTITGLGQVDTSGGDSGGIADAAIATELEILNSDSLRARVTETLRREMLASSVPQFSDWLGRLRTKAQVALRRTPRDPLVAMNEALRTCARSLAIKSVKNTRIVEISCESTSPDVAASFVNALASEYIDQSLEQRLKGIQRMSEWFNTQLQEAKARMEKTEQQLNAFSRNPAMAAGQDSQVDPLLQAKVSQLQHELTAAQAERIDKQMRHQMALSKSANADALDPTLMAARLRLTQLKRDMQELSAAYTPAHYKVKALQTQISDLETQIAKQQDAIIQRAKTDLEAVEKKESLLSANYQAQLRSLTAATNSPKVMDYALLKRQLETDRQIYDVMLHQFNQAGIASVLPTERVRVIDPGVPNRNPSNQDEWLYSGMGMATGCLAGFMLGVVLRYLDRSFKAPGQAAAVLNLPELGAIPSGEFMRTGRGISGRKESLPVKGKSGTGASMEMVVWRENPSPLAESFRLAVTSILHLQSNSGYRRYQVLVVTSAHIREGKSTITSNLAITLAELQQRVLVIDADLRRPRQHDIFNVSNAKPGITLSGVLRDTPTIESYAKTDLASPTEVPNLSVLPAGEGVENINSALNSTRFRELLNRLRGEFDVILVDTPPMMNFSDGRVLARLSDAVILVIRAGYTDRESALAASRRLEEDGAPILGTILNDWTPSSDRAKQYHAYDQYYRR